MMRWGLIPYFAKSASEFKGFSTINAKAETVLERAPWRGPFQKRRCLVPADGFYEWQKIDPKMKKPFVYTLTTGEPFAFAGLWDAWKDPANGEWLQTFAVITTFANELTGKVHDRMPMILHPRDYDRWLDRGETVQSPTDLLRPYEAEEMQADPCNPAVGNVRNNGPEMLSCLNPDEPHRFSTVPETLSEKKNALHLRQRQAPSSKQTLIGHEKPASRS